jgi:VWFA-related protein
MFTVALLGSVLLAQEPQRPRFRVAVDGIRIDAVVTDKKNNVVRDLSADDFEILQDGKPQKVTFAEFVPVPVTAASARSARGLAPAGTAVPGTPDQVQRTFAIVVDDLGLSFAGLSNVRKALRRFVDTALLPTDLVLLVRTGEARSLLQPLTNDREALRAAIDALRYNTSSRKGMAPSADVVQEVHGPAAQEVLNRFQRQESIDGTLAALNLVVQAARDLPGRKTVILASEGFPLGVGPRKALQPPDEEDNSRVRSGVDILIDRATRSGVVLYAINGGALQTAALTGADDYHQITDVRDPRASSEDGNMARVIPRLADGRAAGLRTDWVGLQYLAEQTGGFAVANTNDLAGGFARIGNDVRDYYVLGYEPDHETFASKEESPRLHSIAVKVKRPGVRVRTRTEFIGVSDEEPSGPPTPAQQLVLAARSPFMGTTIAMRDTNLVGYAPGRGLFVRTVLHLDAHALTFSRDANNTSTATVDLVGLVIDTDGVQVGTIATGFNVTVENAALEQGMKDGLAYTARVLLKKPGGYQLRYAVRDRQSGAVGSSGGFVDVPDVTSGAFAISGIVLRAEQSPEVRPSLDSDGFSLRPADALRAFAPGSQLSFMYEVYNAGTAVQTVPSLWRDTVRVAVLRADTLTTPPGGRPLIVVGGLKLPDGLAAGSYVLQLAATSPDPKQPQKARAAVQRISFDVK